MALLKEIEEKQLYIDRDPVLTKEFVDYLEFLDGITERVSTPVDQCALQIFASSSSLPLRKHH